MAERLEYKVPPAPFPGAHDELDALIETLHASGTLRGLNDFFGRLGAVNEVVVKEANRPQARHLLGVLLFAGDCLSKVSPEDLQRIGRGFADGLERAGEVMRSDPPGKLGLLRILDEPETRRSIAAATALLNSIATEVSPGRAKEP